MAEQGAISLEEFKARLPIGEIVGRRVRLQRRGRELLGLCPFHSEKTPSFTVSEAKGFYHCFGCGQHGNAIDFVMATEGLEFAAAIERLAELTGLPAPRRSGPASPPVDPSLHAANEAAARWFAGCLASRAGSATRAYLAQRGVAAATCERFGLGFAPPERAALRRALTAEGFSDRQLVAAGLLIQPEDGEPPYDRFRQRLMFPIHDARGRLAGFGGRALGEARAKYLNTPDTPLFHKGELLYGLAQARSSGRGAAELVVVEGYMDVIALTQAGFQAVAPLGTAITEAQLELLWRHADEPVICLDGDEAGLRAAQRLIERALPVLRPGRSLRFVALPAGQDPDSLIRDQGREALLASLGRAQPLIDFLWQSELAGQDLATPERRAALKQRLRALAGCIRHGELRGLFGEELQRRLRQRFAAAAPRHAGKPGWGRGATVAASPAGAGAGRLAAALGNPERAAEQQLLGMVVVHPELLDDIEEEFAQLELTDPVFNQLHQAIISWYGENGHLDLDALRDHLSGDGLAGVVRQLSAMSAATAWYCRERIERADLLEGWRRGVAQRLSLMERRAMREAVGDAIVHASAGDASQRVAAIDRLLNKGRNKHE